MTSAELKKAESLMSTEDIVNMGNRLVTAFNPSFNPVAAYPPAEGVEAMNSLHRGQLYIGSMVHLFRRAFFLGATIEELMQITKHRQVLEKAFSDHLNYRQSEIDNNIKELSNKYDMNAFMKMDYSVIERSSKAK